MVEKLSLVVTAIGVVLGVILYWREGARLKVVLVPMAYSLYGKTTYGEETGWDRRKLAAYPEIKPGNFFIDLAVIKVTNVGRTPVSVSDIQLDFGPDGRQSRWTNWGRKSRYSCAGYPVLVADFKPVESDVRLEPGDFVKVAFDTELLVRESLSRVKELRAIRAKATAAGRRPTLSPWRKRWKVLSSSPMYFPSTNQSALRPAFIEVFRAVIRYQRGEQVDIEAVGEVWSDLLMERSSGRKVSETRIRVALARQLFGTSSTTIQLAQVAKQIEALINSVSHEPEGAGD